MPGVVSTDMDYGMFKTISDSTELQWVNVAIALSFILFDIGVSTVFRLGLSTSLFIAAVRCTGQLAVVATLLQKVFETENPWLVALIACRSRDSLI
jgi:ABC-type iron transport system FetAB permease component